MTMNNMISFDEAQKIAATFLKSGLFKDTTDIAKATVKILAGAEFGIGPFAAMKGISIIQGSAALGANLIAAKIKSFGRYDYIITKQNDQAVNIDVYDKGKIIGHSDFTIEDAAKAGLLSKDIWRKYPRNMLFARAISNAHRWFCPEIFGGAPVYTPEELDAPIKDLDADLTTIKQDMIAELDRLPRKEDEQEVTSDLQINSPPEPTYNEKVFIRLHALGIDTDALLESYQKNAVNELNEEEMAKIVELGKKVSAAMNSTSQQEQLAASL
jgi:hypothetical protein